MHVAFRSLQEVRTVEPRKLLGLHTIFFHLFLCVQESIDPLLPPPIRIIQTTAILLGDFCAIYIPPPPRLYLFMPYTIQYWS